MDACRRVIRALKNFLMQSTIKKRLILYFILSVLIPTSVFAVTIYYKSASIITKKTDASIEKNMKTAEAIILQKFEHINDISTMIAFNPKVLEILAAERSDKTTAIVEEISGLNTVLESYCLSNQSNFTRTNLMPSIYMLNRSAYKNYGISDKVFDISVIENEKWYREFTTGYYAIVGQYRLKTSLKSMNTIRVARKLYGMRPGETFFAAVLTMDVEAAYFNAILSDIRASSHNQVYVQDPAGTVILSNDVTVPEQAKHDPGIEVSENTPYSSGIRVVDGVEMLVSVKKIPALNWTMVSLSPVSELNGELNAFNRVMFIVIALCVAMAFGIALLLASDISKPIHKLVRSMSSVQDGNFDIRIAYRRHDEFSFLIRQYQKMMGEIRELIDKLYVSELAKKEIELKAREYELKALQAQINPHYLYNTLDSVNWLALKYKAYDISLMVKSLSNFFRYSLSKGKSEILIDEERIQIESYLNIQRIRFKEKLNFSVNFDEDILRFKTVKLILQPIVENAVIHGIDKLKSGGFIRITGVRAGDHIEILIQDNGVGADTEMLNRLLEDEGNTDSFFGTRNVNQRIRQYYGDAFGLNFETNPSGGVTVRVRLPVKE